MYPRFWVKLSSFWFLDFNRFSFLKVSCFTVFFVLTVPLQPVNKKKKIIEFTLYFYRFLLRRARWRGALGGFEIALYTNYKSHRCN